MMAEYKVVPDEESKAANRMSILHESRFEVSCYRTLLERYIWIVPLLCALMFPLFCITMYAVALWYGHIEAVFPYLSDLGALPPEAAYFAQLMDLCAILVVVTGYIRYRQVKHYITTLFQCSEMQAELQLRLYRLNLYSFLSMYPCALGLMIVGNFRSTEVPSLHLAGSTLISGIVFGVLFQVCICRILSAKFTTESSPTTMATALAIGFAASLLTFFFTYASFTVAGFENSFNADFGLHWTKDKPGYSFHILATATEWIAVPVAIPFYFLCLARRMRNFHQWDQVWRS